MTYRSSAAPCAFLLAALVALASCGGSGGGSSATTATSGGGVPQVPTAPLGLNSMNAQDAASGATLAGLGASSMGNEFLNAAAAQPALPKTHVLLRFLREQVARLTLGLQSRPVFLIAAATPVACKVSGTVTFDQADTSAVETFSNCSDVAGSSVDGTITMDNMTLDPGVSFSGTAGFNLTFRQTNSPEVNLTGSNMSALETVNVTVATVTLTGPEMFAVTGTVTERMGNFTFMTTIDASTETDDVTFNYASAKIGGSVNVSASTPFVTAADKDFPRAGMLSISGAGGSKVQVTVNGDESFTTSTQVKIEVDADGDGTFETRIDKNWADLG